MKTKLEILKETEKHILVLFIRLYLAHVYLSRLKRQQTPESLSTSWPALHQGSLPNEVWAYNAHLVLISLLFSFALVCTEGNKQVPIPYCFYIPGFHLLSGPPGGCQAVTTQKKIILKIEYVSVHNYLIQRMKSTVVQVDLGIIFWNKQGTSSLQRILKYTPLPSSHLYHKEFYTSPSDWVCLEAWKRNTNLIYRKY